MSDPWAEAWAWAARVRDVRRQVTDDLAGGSTDLASVLATAQRDPDVGMIALLTVLEARPGASKVATRRRLAELGIDGRSPVAEVDPRIVLDVFGAGG